MDSQQFWWPLTGADTKEFVSTCSVCTYDKSSSVDSEGYSPEEHSWVSKVHILDPQLLTLEGGYCQDPGFLCFFVLSGIFVVALLSPWIV